MSQTHKALKIVFFGSGAFGIPTLERSCDAPKCVDLALVVSQPDRPAGRRRTLTPTPAAQWAVERGIEVVRCEDVNTPEVVEKIGAVGADVFVVIAFGQRMGSALLEKAFAMNLHGSLLPKYRGAAPIQRAMMNGEVQSGVSVITVAARMDAGDVLGQRATQIGQSETAGELHDRLAVIGAELMIEMLEDFRSDEMTRIVQDESLATHAPKLAKADGWVDFAMPAALVRARIHGLNPWPGCWVVVNRERVKLLRVSECDGAGAVEGAPAGTYCGDGLVQCGSGMVHLLEVQAAGGRAMTFDEFARGRAWTVGARLERGS